MSERLVTVPEEENDWQRRLWEHGEGAENSDDADDWLGFGGRDSHYDLPEVEADDDDGSKIVWVALGVLFLVTLVVALIVASVYTVRMNKALASGRLAERATSSSRTRASAARVETKSAADLMAASWVFLGVPFVNVALAGSFAGVVERLLSGGGGGK